MNKKKNEVEVLPPKVLVLRFSSIGDIVLTSPVLRCIKQQRPDVALHFLTKEVFAMLLKPNPNVDKIWTFQKDISEVVDELKQEKFTHILDLHNNIRSLQVKNALRGAQVATVNKLNVRKWLLTTFKINLMPDVSIVERYMDTAKILGVHNDGKGLDYFIPKQFETDNDDIPMSHWAGYIACVIGGSFGTKKFPVEKWKTFCEASPYPIILLGGPEDREFGQLIVEENDAKVYNACGKFNLHESADLVKRAAVVVSNDTGLMHVAAAFKKPIVSLWGNTVPAFGMFPYYGYNNIKERIAPQSYHLKHKKLRCQPCSKIGYEVCPKGHFRCMNELDTELMVNFVKKHFKAPN